MTMFLGKHAPDDVISYQSYTNQAVITTFFLLNERCTAYKFSCVTDRIPWCNILAASGVLVICKLETHNFVKRVSDTI